MHTICRPFKRLCPVFLLVMVGLVGALPAIAGNPTLTKAEVIGLANEAAKRAGYDLGKYDAHPPSYEFARKDDTWWVEYAGKDKSPVNVFGVRIRDKSREVKVFGGRW